MSKMLMHLVIIRYIKMMQSGKGGEATLVGRATGGNYGFRVQKSLALAMVKPEFSKVGTLVYLWIY